MIDRAEILKLAKLSKLTLSESEIQELTKDMQSIVSFADLINNAECSDIETEEFSSNTFRDDYVESSYNESDLLKNSKTVKDGFFLLPRRQK